MTLPRALAGLALVAGLAVLPACSGAEPPPVCAALDEGQDPLTAARTAYGDAQGDSATAARMLRQGATDIRAGCPEQAPAAGTMENLATTLGLAD